jgi:glycosyltransferase involved in cell wall biosynthesis
MSEVALSVVIIGRNEGSALVRCLESLALTRGVEGNVEVIYVDSASTDGSSLTASRLGAKVVVLDREGSTAARGRNAGWRLARAPYVLFLDGDTILNPEFTKLALSAIVTDPTIVAVWGHRRETRPQDSLYNRVLDLDWIYAPGDAEFCGGDVLMRRSALEEVEGYDPTMIAGEEPELCRRLRARSYRILHIDAPMTGHDLKITRFSQYWKRAMRAGHAYAEVSDRFRDSDDPMWLRESKSNLIRGGFWIGSFAVSLALLGFSRVPLSLWLLLLGAVSVRSAWKARWKAPGSAGVLLLYGIHSHLQQVPIFFGQLQFRRDRKAGRRRKLIEYKQGSGA